MGPYLGTPNTDKESEDGVGTNVKWGACSMQGWRKSQEDAHIAKTDLSDGVMCFGVFDGHGGPEVSRFVKEIFIEQLTKCEEFKIRQYDEALRSTFIRIDEILREPEGIAKLKLIKDEFGNPDPFAGGTQREDNGNVANCCGCTATVIIITQTHIFCANAGDSRVVLGRASGDDKCFPLSDDHKPDNPEERARIEAAGGFVEENRVNGSLNLSRSLGDFDYKNKEGIPSAQQMVICEPEVRSVARKAIDQFVILACDGIWDCLTSEECIEQTRTNLTQIEEGKPISSVIENMFD